jgi:hypothetical protein
MELDTTLRNPTSAQHPVTLAGNRSFCVRNKVLVAAGF